ncbi:MAG: DUF2779 domain-containing protein [Bacteroidetes bacterium]|nr:DUF2779 domain-containing protein [Bacteroidota bacterium]
MINFSKSSFMYGCQCPKRLFLHKFKREVADVEDDQTMARYASRTDAGVLAQQVFPGGYDAQQEDKYPWIETAYRTKEALRFEEVIYEATFIHEDVLCAVDILVKTEEGYDVYEVKSVNSVKEQHEQDGALQYYVLAGAGIDVRNFYILHFNKKYVRRGEIDVERLFLPTNITEACRKRQSWVRENLHDLREMLSKGAEPNIPMGPQCNKPYACNFQGYCSQLNAIEPEAQKELNGSIEQEKESLRTYFKDWHYPLYFFDFETCMFGVPEFDECRPWQQIPFQFSLHMQSVPGAEMKHYEFLGSGTGDPRNELIQKMKKVFGMAGSIVTWNKHFEIGRFKELARDFPSEREFIEPMIERVVDLMVPFKKGWVSSEAFGGSASIKNVLPVMVPELDYSMLEIQEGGSASFIYSQLQSMDEDTAEKTKAALLEYCKMDTLAMVRIWELLANLHTST